MIIPFSTRIIVSMVFLYPMMYPKDKDVSAACEIRQGTDIKHLNSTEFRDMLLRVGNCTAVAQHRRWSRHGGYVTLINATPYDWNLTSTDQNQMEYNFPGLIPAGTTHEQYINFVQDHADGAAEAVYTLIDAPSPASFSVEASHRGDKEVSIQYHDTLSSLNNPVNSKINLGFQKDGEVSFILSGTGPSFVSSNPPTGWMQSSISSIGTKYLREIAMPASHNSGMNKLSHHHGGVDHNTVTQSSGVYAQAENGARYFDIRPVLRKGTFYTGHFSKVMGKHVGGTGSTIVEIVNDINTFNRAFPGELIILDISHDMSMDRDFKRFNEKEWQELYRLLDSIVDLWAPAASWERDLSNVPLSTFITPGSKSAVVVRLPYIAPLPVSQEAEVTGVSHVAAFIPDTWLPVVNVYSNTNKPSELSTDQIKKMNNHQVSDDGMLMGVWTLTEKWQHSLDIANHKHSIVGDAVQAHRRLFSDLWPAMSKERHPNLIQVDDIHSKEVLALTMAINNNFVGPVQLARRDNSAEESTPPPPKAKCSWFDLVAHMWRLYPKEECQKFHPFQALAKNAQELAKEWEYSERANAHAKANDTEGMKKDEEEWQSRQAVKAMATEVGAPVVQATAVKAADGTVTAAPEVPMEIYFDSSHYRGKPFSYRPFTG